MIISHLEHVLSYFLPSPWDGIITLATCILSQTEICMLSSRGPATTAKTSLRHLTSSRSVLLLYVCQFIGEFPGLKFLANAAKFIKGKKNLASCVSTFNIKRGQKLDRINKYSAISRVDFNVPD